MFWNTFQYFKNNITIHCVYKRRKTCEYVGIFFAPVPTEVKQFCYKKYKLESCTIDFSTWYIVTEMQKQKKFTHHSVSNCLCGWQYPKSLFISHQTEKEPKILYLKSLYFKNIDRNTINTLYHLQYYNITDVSILL